MRSVNMCQRLNTFACPRRISAWVALFLLVSATPLLVSQTLSGINGTVTDASGAVIAEASVTVTNNATQVSKTASTSSAGTYTVTDLIPGTYTVKVTAAGFQASSHNGVGVEVGRVSTVDVEMQPGSVQ